MKKQKNLFTQKSITGIIIFFVLMMIAGTIWDYSISCALYNESNAFGITFAAFGEYPAMLGFVAAGTLLLTAHNRKNKLIGIVQCICGILLVVLGTLSASFLPTLYLSWPKPVCMIVGLVCSILVIMFIARLGKEADRAEAIRVAAMIFSVIFAEMILINIIKVPWGRARMRLISSDSRAYFMPWWQVGDSLKSTLMAAGVAAEEFKSFPSGHTGNASTLMLLGLLPRLSSRFAGKTHLLVGIGFAWGCLVAFSRIIMGAHFLTDTTVGFAVGFACLLLFEKLVFNRKK